MITTLPRTSDSQQNPRLNTVAAPNLPPTRQQIDKYLLESIKILKETVARLEKENKSLRVRDINTGKKLANLEGSLNETVKERRSLKEKVRVLENSLQTINRNQVQLGQQTTRLLNEHNRFFNKQI